MSKPPKSINLPLLAIVLLVVGGGIFVAHEALDRPHPRTAEGGGPSRSPVAAQRTIPQILADLNGRLSPSTFPYFNYGRAVALHASLEDPSIQMTTAQRLDTGVKCGVQLMNAGKTKESIELFASLIEQLKAGEPKVWKSLGCDLLTFEAVAYLRMGEEQNCCSSNNARSCLLPISGAGVHTRQEGSRGAIRCLTQALGMSPSDMSARWLLNIAYMTVGEYPGGVPGRWLIPLNRFGGEYPMPRFPNVAPSLGLDALGWSGSVIMEDFEGRGLLDLVISSSHFDTPLRYFRNNGNGTFTERSQDAGFTGEVGGLNIITTDYNNDGLPDIVVLRGGWWGSNGHYPLSLLRNDGGGHFTDVTIQSGLLTLGPTQTAVTFDYNGDGLLDLFIGYESTPGDPVPCKLFRNNGDGTFTDVTKLCGLNVTRFVKAVATADFMRTGRPGLYLSCSGQPNMLLRNDGPAGADKSPRAAWKFTEIGHEAGVDLQHKSFSCMFFDYDNDGWPDIYVNGYGGQSGVGDIANDYLGKPTISEKAKLYRNNRNGTFTDVSRATHLDKVVLGMGMNFGDLDNDGWLDFYVGTGDPDLATILPNRMFRNHDGKYFDEVTTTADVGHLQKGHGIAFGDLRNNGLQDVFLVAGGANEGDTAHNCLYLNPGNRNHWINLSLTGVRANRPGIGAVIKVTVATPRGERTIYRTVNTGGSFGNNPLRQEIGLGDALKVNKVEIDWPGSGLHQTITGPLMDRFYRVREGDASAVEWTPRRFDIKQDAEAAP